MRFLKVLWVLAGAILVAIGLAGIPDDIAQWASWIKAIQPFLNEPINRFLILLFAALLILGGIAYRGAKLLLPVNLQVFYRLRAIEQIDHNNLTGSLPRLMRQVEIQQSKEGPVLRFYFRFFNGSVFSLKCVRVAGKSPIFKESNPDKRTNLPMLTVQGNPFQDLHHAELGDVVLELMLSDDLVETIKSAVEKYNKESGSNARFDLRECVLIVLAQETDCQHALPLPAIHISEALPLGLGDTLSSFD